MKKTTESRRESYGVLTMLMVVLLLFFFTLGELALVYTDKAIIELLFLSAMWVLFWVAVYAMIKLITVVSALPPIWGRKKYEAKKRICSKLKANDFENNFSFSKEE